MHALLLGLTLAVSTPSPTVTGTMLTAANIAEVETLTLEEALAALRTQSPDLRSMRAAIDDADAAARSSLAAVKPFISVSAGYTLNNDEALLDLGEAFAGIGQALEQATGMPADLGDTGGATTIQARQAATAGLQVQVPLFAANAYADIRAARVAIEVAQADAAALEVQLLGALRRTVWLAGAADAFVGVAERAVGNAAAHAERTKRQLAAGQTTQLTVDQAQLALLQRQNDLVTAKAELEKTQLVMGVMIGRPGPVRIALPEVVTLERVDLDTAVTTALAQRGELTARRADEKAAQLRVRSARMRYAPTLAATFGANANTAEYVTGLNYAWQVGLSLNWTLYAGGSRRSTKQRADAGVRLARARLQQQELAVRQEVLDAHRELNLAGAKLRLSTEEATVAASAAASAQRMFAEGRASSLDVLDALDSSFQAELRREEARARAAAALVQLDAAQGQP